MKVGSNLTAITPITDTSKCTSLSVLCLYVYMTTYSYLIADIFCLSMQLCAFIDILSSGFDLQNTVLGKDAFFFTQQNNARFVLALFLVF